MSEFRAALPGHSLYNIWNGIRQRCLNPRSAAYRLYGARGITVCERWLVFANFFADMAPRPYKASIDRIDNNGNYEPGNCRWATHKVQANNCRSNVLIEINGETKTKAQWAEGTGLKYGTFHMRLNNGWTPEEAVSIELVPVNARGKKKTPGEYYWKSGASPLTEEDVFDILYLAKQGSSPKTAIALLYGVDQSTVVNIVKGKRWSRVTKILPP